MQKISELTPGSGKECIGTVMQIGSHEDWFCHCNDCSKKFRTKGKIEDIRCPNCQAKATSEKGQGVLASPTETLIIEDDSGSILLDVYDDKARKFMVGDRVHLMSAYVKEFIDNNTNKPKLSITPGRYGGIRKE